MIMIVAMDNLLTCGLSVSVCHNAAVRPLERQRGQAHPTVSSIVHCVTACTAARCSKVNSGPMQRLAVKVWRKAEGGGTEARGAGGSRGVGGHCSHPHSWQGHQKALEAATHLHRLVDC